MEVKLRLYCFVMRGIWRIANSIYNWTEDRRPGGGFHVDNYRTGAKPWRKRAA